MRRTLLVFGIALTLSAQYQNSFKVTWLEPGGGEVLPEFDAFDSSNGTLGVLNASGSLKTDGHPFFTALGTNGRACVTCHQPTWGMSVSASGLVDRWRATDGKDPVFAAFDGSNCPEPAAGEGKLAFAPAQARALPDSARLAAAQCRRLAEAGRVHDRGRARPDRLQHQPRVRSQERPADDLRLSASAHGGES